ncbi:MAG: hypothetical protein QOH35_2663 [Acidobacteriaceae bacterium]|jgi:hypothetical protein|nr:hypothetical protein [Acidobacteriaceae bacterium]
MIPAAKEVGSPEPSASDPRRALVDRIIVSSTFAKCERLSSLLAYVCDLTLNGRVKEINEQKIGEAVFGRARNYDSSIDGIVRTQASRLRQRLELYFREEGSDEPLRIVIPRGGYVPVFAPRSTPVVPMLTPTVVPEQPAGHLDGPGSFRGSRSAAIAWSLVAILLVAIVTILLVNRGAAKAQVVRLPVHPLWNQILVAEQRTLEVPGDSGLVMWQGILGKSVGLAEYLNGDYRTNLLPRSVTALRDTAVDMGGRRYTSIVDLEAAKSLSLMAQSARSRLEVRYARDVRPNDLKQGNVILVGAAEANPWVELFEHNMNFVFFNDRVGKTFSVLNREPRGGEPLQWDSHYTDAQHRVYAVVAFLPNLGGNGNALILEGTSMAGTESAWDFVSDDSQLLPFLKRIQLANGSVPHFELVLGTNNMSGSAVKNTVLAWRTTN